MTSYIGHPEGRAEGGLAARLRTLQNHFDRFEL